MSVTPRLATLAALLPACLHRGAAHASIDPNAGGMLFQLLAPAVAAAVGAWLCLRRWIAEAVRNLRYRLTDRRSE